MATYTVYMINTVSTAIEVEASDDQDAIDKAYESPDMPGSISIQAFGSVSVDAGDWEPNSVTDANGAEVWRESNPERES